MTRTNRQRPDPTPFVTNDLALDESALVAAFAADYTGKLRYDHSRRIWFVCRDHFWRPDGDGVVIRCLQAFLRRRLVEASGLVDSSDRRTHTKFLEQQLRAAQIPRLLTLAASQKAFATTGTGWDRDPMLLGVRNGVVDLRTGSFRPGQAGDYITLVAGTPFDPDATCPRFDRFMDEVFPDVETRTFVDLAIGYTLTGLTNEQKLMILHGVGGNGKTVLLETMRCLLGDYARTMSFTSLTSARHRGGEQPHSDLAALPGIRFLCVSEVQDNVRLDEGRIKSLTGGDAIACRPLYGRWFQFVPGFKLWWAVNSLPQIGDTSDAFWRRIRVIECVQRFDQNGDDRLLDQLNAERPGILNRAIASCLRWQEHGLPLPAGAVAATDAWRADSDPLTAFLDSGRVQFGPAARATSASLYLCYGGWAESQSVAPSDRLSHKRFGTQLRRRFRSVEPGGAVTYLGIEITPGKWEV